eukprot:TRINITY_DN32852_c0_g1_i1.p1 TRINITY_DN32852_c0_g1~~TRINITY_DN32852_c0_g1_i1.p1  ORF type:complete len:704 (-),score=104.98 TRINITY_DN32852_c0_g1_i1:146-2224(-)
MEASVRRAVSENCPEAAKDIADYLADTACSILEEEHGDRSAFQGALKDAVEPFLEEYDVSQKEVVHFCELVALETFPSEGEARNSCATKASSAGSDADLLCRLPDLLMMYGGSKKPLLRNATLELFRGRRYGVVGANGSGKSTLISRIASKDMAGFPQALKVVHLSYDKIVADVSPKTIAREYAQLRSGVASRDISEGDLSQALVSVGFEEELLEKPVLELSGGWQMRLALACAVAQKANLLLLDEPTNHLDAAGVTWLIEFVRSTCVGGESGGTAIIISHDADFLDQTCTDVMHITSDAKLEYHHGSFSTFKTSVLGGNQEEAARLLETNSCMAGGVAIEGGRMAFPAPEKIGATAAARKLPILTLQDVTFRYSEDKPAVLSSATVALSMESRIGILGQNGAGKSTLLALLSDRLKPSSGEMWSHQNLRLSYVAQHHLVHLGQCMNRTPVEYMQERFRQGFDAEVPQKEARKLTPSEEADRKRLGIQFGKKSKPVQELISRKEVLKHASGDTGDKEYLYQVRWEGLSDAEISWERKGKLLKCGAEALVDDLDERLWRAWAGIEQRPLSTDEIVRHLESFGLPEEVCSNRKISMLSSGQKVKLMFGGALWTRPHILCLDEPTNFLDADSVDLLKDALKGFRGGYAIVTHNEHFAAEVCTENWTVAEGRISGAKPIWGKAQLSKQRSARCGYN